MSAQLAFYGVCKQFDTHRVLDGVDLLVQRGQVHFVMGPSGAGKSVLIKHVVGLLRPDAGRIELDGVDITTARGAALRAVRARCQLLLQAPTLFDQFDVLHNVALPLQSLAGVGEKSALAQAQAALQLVKAEHWAHLMPEALSIGAQKRVTLARALALKPEVLLYDEPTTGLDPIAARDTDDLIASITRTLGLTALVVSHDLVSAKRIAQQVSFLHEGKIAATLTPAAFFASDSPQLRQFTQPAPLAFVQGGA